MLLLTFRQCLMQPDTYPTKLETKPIPRIAEKASVRYKGLLVAQTSTSKTLEPSTCVQISGTVAGLTSLSPKKVPPGTPPF